MAGHGASARLWLLLFLVGAPGAAGGEAVEQPLAPPGADSWRPLHFPRIARHTEYTALEEDGRPVLRARSRCAASALLLPLGGVDLEATPRLGWRWRVEQGLGLREERTRAGDDFAARVYVAFPVDLARVSRWERLRRRALALVYGDELPGNAINYVWTSGLAAGVAWNSPRTEHSRMISLGSGPLPEWRNEEVDVAADYRAAFGTPPPRPLFLAVMTDSDDSCREATSWYTDFRLVGPA